MSGADCDTFAVSTSVLMLLLAELLRRNLWWTRELVFGLALLVCLSFALENWNWAVPSTLLDMRVIALALGLCAYWYFYRKPEVKAFYDLLKRGPAPEPRDRGGEARDARRTTRGEEVASQEADDDPGRSQPVRPRLISALISVLFLSAVAAPAVAVLMLLHENGSITQDLWFLNDTAEKTTASHRAFWHDLGGILVLAALAYGILAAMFAESLRQGIWWTRVVMFGLYFLVVTLSDLFSGGWISPSDALAPPLANLLNLAAMIAFCFAAFWYLYRKPNVKAYYDGPGRLQAAPGGQLQAFSPAPITSSDRPRP